ncbi:MAG TPA: type II toxin-antitoxin system VapC family toxin, partial [Pirellulales bacterium]|nr:type II toxin-antitoxin system VapC family toxin [Pirellulales bacterium]
MKRRFLLDTGIAQDYQETRHGVRERAIEVRKSGHRIGICVPVLGELWSGIECSSSRERNLARLRHSLSTLIIRPFTTVAAEEYGRVQGSLSRIGPRDQWIGTVSKRPADKLLRDAELVMPGGVTYAALILLGSHAALGRLLAQAEVIFEYRSTPRPVPANQREEFRQAFLSFDDR